MTSVELQAFRKLLFFTTPEAAYQLGQCSAHTWRQWESGERVIPENVSEMMHDLVHWRQQAVEAMRAEIARACSEQGAMPEVIELTWFESLSQWLNTPGPAGELRDPIHWRPHQSVLAQIATEYPNVMFTKPLPLGI